MDRPKAALFDLDDTLAESFEVPSEAILKSLSAVVRLMPVAIITGRDFARVEPGFLPALTDALPAGRLFVLPESSARGLEWDGSEWKEQYAFLLNKDERERIRTALEESISETGVLDGAPQFGERFLEKPSQTAFAMLGLKVPHELKYSWDRESKKRKVLQKSLAAKLPDFEVLLGGATSIDVTKRGVDKSYGVRWLSKRLNIPASEMFYVGDALSEGGNDFVVIQTGIQTRETSGPDETLKIIDELLKACST